MGSLLPSFRILRGGVGVGGGLRLSSSLPRVRVTRVRAFSLSVLGRAGRAAARLLSASCGAGVLTRDIGGDRMVAS